MVNKGVIEVKKMSNELMNRKNVSFEKAVRLACIFYYNNIRYGSNEFEEKINEY